MKGPSATSRVEIDACRPPPPSPPRIVHPFELSPHSSTFASSLNVTTSTIFSLSSHVFCNRGPVRIPRGESFGRRVCVFHSYILCGISVCVCTLTRYICISLNSPARILMKKILYITPPAYIRDLLLQFEVRKNSCRFEFEFSAQQSNENIYNNFPFVRVCHSGRCDVTRIMGMSLSEKQCWENSDFLEKNF